MLICSRGEAGVETSERLPWEISLEVAPAPRTSRQADVALTAVTPCGIVALPGSSVTF